MLNVSFSKVMSCVVFVVFLLILLRLQVKMTQLRAIFEEFIRFLLYHVERKLFKGHVMCCFCRYFEQILAFCF